VYPLVPERGPVEHRDELEPDRPPADGLLDFRDRGFLLVHVLLHHLLVRLAQHFDHFFSFLFNQVPVFVRDVPHGELVSEDLLPPVDFFPFDQVDHPAEILLPTHRDLDRQRPGGDARPELVQGPFRIRAHPVHLVDVDDPGDPILIGLPPDGFGLGLHPADAAQYRDRSVQHPQRALDFRRKINVSGSIDDVDPVVIPDAGGGRGRDRYAALLLLNHPVHDRRSLVHLSHLVSDSRIEQDSLRRGRLPRIDMGHDAYIPDILDRVRPHVFLSP